MKRYLLFQFDSYYPNGGWQDVSGSYDDLVEALSARDAKRYDWFHVVDSNDGAVVATNQPGLKEELLNARMDPPPLHVG